MAETDVDIDGEQFNLVSIPNAESKLVQDVKQEILGTLDLHNLVEDFRKLGNFMCVAYNGVAGHTEIQIKVQDVGYTVTKLADKSAVTVHKFKGASQSVLHELQGTYQYLLDGLEEMALETLSQLTSVAKDMAAAADELHKDFEKAADDVKVTLEDTQRAKGSEEEREKAREKEREEFEIKKNKAVTQQENANEAEKRAEVFYNEAQKREDKAIDWIDAQSSLLNTLKSVFTGTVSAAGSVAMLKLEEAARKIASIGDTSGHKEAMKMANKEKQKQMEEMQKQRDLRQEAYLQYQEFAERIKNCQDDNALAEAAIEALHSSIGALKSLSTIMMKAAMFWQQMQSHCESLAKGKMQKQVERAMKMDEEKRIKTWNSTGFKKKALRYYSRWVALDDVCGVYMLHVKKTREELYNYLKDNPTIEQARNNVRTLAAAFERDLKEAQEKLNKENMKALEAKKELEKADE